MKRKHAPGMNIPVIPANYVKPKEYPNPITGEMNPLDLDNPEPEIYAGVSHWDYLKINAVSRSLLSRFDEAVEYVHAPQEPPSESMIFGTAYHAFVLDRDYFSERFVEGPRYRRSNDEKKLYRDLVEKHGGPEYIYRSSDLEKMEAMYDVLTKYPKSHVLLTNDNPTELTVIFRHPTTGLMCKIRIDKCIVSSPNGWVIDLKTSKSVDPNKFAWSVKDYKYDLQAGFYILGCQLTEGLRHVNQFAIVAQEKKESQAYRVKSFNMHEKIGPFMVESERMLIDYKAWIDSNMPRPDDMEVIRDYSNNPF